MKVNQKNPTKKTVITFLTGKYLHIHTIDVKFYIRSFGMFYNKIIT